MSKASDMVQSCRYPEPVPENHDKGTPVVVGFEAMYRAIEAWEQETTEEHEAALERLSASKDILLVQLTRERDEIQDALHLRRAKHKEVVDVVRAWADELHALRGRLQSWAASFRLLARACEPTFDTEAPFTAKRGNEIHDLVLATLARLAREHDEARAAARELGEAGLTFAIAVERGRFAGNEEAFLAVLNKHGLEKGAYGLPDPTTPTYEQLTRERDEAKQDLEWMRACLGQLATQIPPHRARQASSPARCCARDLPHGHCPDGKGRCLACDRLGYHTFGP